MSKEANSTERALKLALEALENNRRTHYYCEDTWYSCPKHEEGCANESEGDECNCGADKANVEIDGAITALREALNASLAKPDFWEGYVPEPVKPAQCKYPKCSYPCTDLPDCRDAEQPAQQDSTCSNALRAQGKAYPRTCKKCGLGPCVELAQQALDKKAENARELGLMPYNGGDYEPAQQEPVAYIHRQGNHYEVSERFLSDDEKSRGWTEEPLYTSPPTLSLAQRKPLTDDEILAIARNHYNPHQRPEISFARAIEAAHGIKENT